MASWIVGRMRCMLGKHERSREQARKTPGTDNYTSVCTYCSVPMQRRAKRDWIVAPKP